MKPHRVLGILLDTVPRQRASLIEGGMSKPEQNFFELVVAIF